MLKSGFYILFLLLFNTLAFARTVTCTGGVSPISFTLPSSSLDNVTSGLSGNTSTYRELYTYDYFMWGKSGTNCRSSTNGAQLGWMEYAYSTSGKSPIKYGSHYIFPTKIDGLGISFYDSNVTHKSLGSYSEGAVNRASWNLTTAGYSWGAFFKIKVKLWKIPGRFNPSQFNGDGMLEFDDIKVVQALQITSAGDTWAAGMPDRGASPLTNSWTTNEVALKGGFNVYPGTCDIASQTVYLGKFSPSEIPDASPWENISLTMNCPQAWGYGRTTLTNAGYYDDGDVASPNNIASRGSNTGNSGIIITVYPRTTIIDNTRSIIGLKSGGAEGYGIQLAWGTAAAQPMTGDPTNKVLFNLPNVVNTTNYGNTGQTTTQVINMVARYIRTTGIVQAGQADASIEMVASYN